jgi:ketosteroid isomerase-like protein
MSTEEDGPQITGHLMERFNHHDAPGVAALFEEDARVRMAKTTPLSDGREQIEAFFESIFGGWPDCRWTRTAEFAQGDLVCMEFRFNGSSASRPDVPIETWDCGVFRVQDGMIAEGHFYYDTGSIAKQRAAHDADRIPVPPSPADTLLNEWRATFNGRDWDAHCSLYTDDVHWTFPPGKAELHGRGETRAALERFASRYPDVQLTVERCTGSDEHLAVEWAERGTERDSGEGTVFAFLGFMEIRGGLIARVDRYGGRRQ